MSPEQKMVDDFHKFFKLQRPVTIDLLNLNVPLRISLMEEELREFKTAAEAKDPVGMIDALVDLLYVTYGSAVSMGVDLEEYFAEVHRSNMTKLGADGKPLYRADGKLLKGPNYEPPRLEPIFEKHVLATQMFRRLCEVPPEQRRELLRSVANLFESTQNG